MASAFNKRQKILMSGLAAAMLRAGRPLDYVKRITHLSTVFLIANGLVMPSGSPYNFSNPRNGKTNKQLKREDRKAFFNSRRWRKRHADR